MTADRMARLEVQKETVALAGIFAAIEELRSTIDDKSELLADESSGLAVEMQQLSDRVADEMRLLNHRVSALEQRLFSNGPDTARGNPMGAVLGRLPIPPGTDLQPWQREAGAALRECALCKTWVDAGLQSQRCSLVFCADCIVKRAREVRRKFRIKGFVESIYSFLELDFI